jgi:hypothetical protein
MMIMPKGCDVGVPSEKAWGIDITRLCTFVGTALFFVVFTPAIAHAP